MEFTLKEQDARETDVASLENQEPSEGASIADLPGPPLPLADIARGRAPKIDMAVQSSPGIDSVFQSLMEGRERDHRKNIANEKHYADKQQRLNIIDQISRARDVPFTPQEMEDVMTIARTPNGALPLETILEKKYSQEFLKNVFQLDQIKNITEAWEKGNPEALSLGFSLASGVMAKREVFRTIAEDATSRREKSSWGEVASKVGHELFTLGFGSTYAMYNAVADKRFAVLTGKNREEQFKYINALPIDEAHAVLTDVLRRLDPFDAETYAKGILDYNREQGNSQSFWDVFNVAAVAGPFLMKFISKYLKLPINVTNYYNPDNKLQMISEVERKIMSLKASPVTADLNRPYFDTYGLISQAEVELLKRRPSPLSADNLGAVDGTIQSMERPRPMTSYEVFNALRGADKLPPRLEGLGPSTLGASWRQVTTLVKDVVQAATEDSPPKIEKVLAATGDIKAASQAAVTKAPIVPDGHQGLKDQLHSVFKVDGFIQGASSFSREYVTRLQNLLTTQAGRMMGVLDDHIKHDRINPQALDVAFVRTEEMMRDRLQPNVNSAVINTIRNPGIENTANVGSVTLVLGKKDGTAFTSWQQAKTTGQLSYRLAPDGFEVVQYGGGHYISVTSPIDETGVRDVVFKTTQKYDTNSPVTEVVKTLASNLGLRSSVYTTSETNSQNRFIAQHAAQLLQSVAKEVFDNIAALSKTERSRMNQVWTLDRDYIDQGKVGRFANSLGEFEANYVNIHNVKPSEKEAAAYFSYRQLNDFDYVIRNMTFYKEMSRVGGEQFRFKMLNPDPEIKGRAEYAPYFIGREVKELPFYNQAPAGIYVNTPEHRGKYWRTSDLPPDVRTYLEEGLKLKEFRAVQLVNPMERPLHDSVTGHGGDLINFVVAKDVQQKPLDQFMIPYRPGGHREYSATHYIKQAIMSPQGGRESYEGDVTILGAHSAAEAKDWHKKLTEATRLYKLNLNDELKAYLEKNLPAEEFSYDKFIRFFTDKSGNRARWNVNEPFVVTESGKNVYQVDKNRMLQQYGDRFHNEHDSPWNIMKDVDKKFIGSRDPDLWALRNIGTEELPVIKTEKAALIEPLVSLNRTVSNAAAQRLLSDYKIAAAEEFAAKYAHLMKASPKDIEKNPQYYLHSPDFRNDFSVANQVAEARAAQSNILQFLHMDPVDVKWVKWLENQAVDMIYNAGAKKTATWTSEKLVAGINDPVSYARAVAYHSKFAFNPLQLTNQIQGVVHSWAMAGVEGLRGTMAAIASQRLRFTENPAILAWYDKSIVASATGWKPGQFTEAYQQLQRSGFKLVQGENSWKDDVRDPQLVRSTLGKVLDAGSWFFREGERFARETAYYTAYKEFRKTNPTKKFDDYDAASVLARAEQLNNYMTRAAQAPIQGGVLSIPTQFWSYQWRLAEQLNPFSKRLTAYEKLRAYGVYGTMYGAPVAAGIPVAVWPMYDTLRQYAIEKGYDWNANTITKAVFEGLPALILAAATGKDVSSRYGPQGIPAIREAVHSGDVWKLLVGASGQTIHDIAKSLSPVVAGVIQGVLEGNPKFWDSAKFPLVSQDWQDTTQNLSIVNHSIRSYYAWNLRMYYTKGGLPVGEMDKLDAAIFTASGLFPRKIADTFLKMDSLKQEKAIQEDAQKEITNEIRRAMEAAVRKDYDAYDRHMSRARTHFIGAGFRQDQWGQVFKRATMPSMPLTDQIDWDFNYRRAPLDRLQRNVQ